MDKSPLMSPNAPRFAPPRMHVRNASHSPTRKRFADDLLSDLSPATTLEAFTNPSGKLKASIEAATPSERAFGIRATLASKKIQEWVEELSNWPWPKEGGSVGFEMPPTKRRKLSDPFTESNGSQNYEKTGMTNGDEPEYIGSLLADEVDRYEVRIDEIQTDMEDLNVEDIKRQVLDTHFSPRSRPSSSASNAPMPQSLSSYTKMDDFTAIVTSTVLQSLPNLSKLMRLMDVWSIRLSVLRKVPALLLALEDMEIALKSGWSAIQTPTTEGEYLSRETFNVMRRVLRDKVTTLGQDLDFLLDTLEGRQDTLPDAWLDRMEIIENEYGSWDVAGDRKVREGEWAKLAKRRKEEDDTRKLREAEAVEIARQKAEREAKEDVERIARQKAEDEARRKAEREAQEAHAAEAARLQAEKDAEDAARRKARMEADALEAARLKAEREATAIEAARIQAEREAEAAARRNAEQEAQDLARRRAEEEAAMAEAARIQAVQEAEAAAQRKAEQEAQYSAQQKAEEEAARLQAEREAKAKAEHEARDLARRKAEEDAAEAARLKTQQEAEQAEAARLKLLKDTEDEKIRRAQLEQEVAEAARLKADQDAADAIRRQAEQDAKEAAARKAQEELEAACLKAQQEAEQAETARLKALKDAEDEAIRKAQLEKEVAEAARLKADQEAANAIRRQAEQEATDAAARKAQQEAEKAEIARLAAGKEAQESAIRKAKLEAEVAELSRLQAQREAEEAEVVEQVRLKAEKDAAEAKIAKQQAEKQAADRFAVEAARIQAEVDAAKRKSEEDAEDADRARLQAEREAADATAAETARWKASEDARTELARLQTEQASETARPEKEAQDSQAIAFTRDADNGSPQGIACTICDELQDIDEPASLQKGARVTMGSTTSTEISTQSSNFFDAVKPSITRYAPLDGANDEYPTPLLLSISDDTQLEHDSSAKQSVLDSPTNLNSPSHLEPAFPASPTRSIKTEPEEPVTPQSHKMPRVGHAFANALRHASSSPQPSGEERPQSSSSFHREHPFDAEDFGSPKVSDARPRTPVKLLFPTDGTEDLLGSSQTVSMKSNDDGWVVITSSDDEDINSSGDSDKSLPQTESVRTSPSKNRDSDSASSLVLSYSAADPTPEIQEAEPAEYFQPVLTPVKNARSPTTNSQPVSLSNLYAVSPAITIDNALPALDGPVSPGSPLVSSPHGMKAVRGRISPNVDDECEVCDSIAQEQVERPASIPILARKTSVIRINTGVRRISISRRDSVSSEASTIITGRGREPPSSPVASPISDSPLRPFFEDDDASPSAGRVGLRDRKSYDYSPPDSPRIPKIFPQESLQILKSPNLSPPDSTAPSTPVDAPVFDNLDVTTAPISSSPKKATTDEQIQQQISSLLESIPARIRLTSEPEGAAFTSQSLRPRKTRRSVTPNMRPSSSMSNYSTSTTYSRAPTPGPQFTLAPAFAKTGQRTRTHNGNPEIKLYHLSRSTGEAPIKLFVRLVGEHGERVMVRVGGGWADLGEYLKEYASHHGRRSAADTADKVEIQDLPPRIASNSSTTSTLRGSGRDTPVPRPFSVLERERPASNLNVRKTRKSIGDYDPSPVLSRKIDTRNPSTPLPIASRRPFETPPSAASVASSSNSGTGTGPSGRSSRLSWTDEDSSLGLAGPKAKKVMISERDQEWVESMKEKVRQASAEKEKKERIERDRERTTSFGEMDKESALERKNRV
ncbi:hypothetical protein EG329_000879 [Mollisiaceae sp. DMI_Dod_QoI]|nr:hypothetical protein EG329_000879 [Helotiales sp. DMI_Dod_QoI]